MLENVHLDVFRIVPECLQEPVFSARRRQMNNEKRAQR